MEQKIYYTKYIKEREKTQEEIIPAERQLTIEDLFRDSLDIEEVKKEYQSLNKTEEEIPKVDFPQKVTYYDTKNNIIKRLSKDHQHIIFGEKQHYLKDKVIRFIQNMEMDGKTLADQYTIFKIPKATGGYRTIKAPNEELKKIQRETKEFLEDVLKLYSHNNAFAYIKNRCVKDAVEVHQRNQSKWFLKLDLKDFFNYCTPQLVREKLSELFPIALMGSAEKGDLFAILNNIAYLDGGLPQGTPLSPTLTNLIMTSFDKQMTKIAYANNLRYTRYADDLLITSKYNFKAEQVEEVVSGLLKSLNYPFEIKKEKTRYGSANGSNWNLGLMLNKDNNITIGHKRKKHIKNALRNLSKTWKTWEQEDGQILNGELEWLRANEPAYFVNLIEYANKKYGTDMLYLIKLILKQKNKDTQEFEFQNLPF